MSYNSNYKSLILSAIFLLGLPFGVAKAATQDCLLKPNATGQAVKELQSELVVVCGPGGGFDCAPPDVNGQYDSKTADAVKVVQEYFKVTADDGQVGPPTFSALNITLASHEGCVAPAAGSPTTPTDSSTSACPPGLTPSNGSSLCMPASQFSGGVASSQTLWDLAFKIITFLLAFAGIVAVAVIIIGGFWYLTSAGNEERSEKGKKALINAVIGLVVVILAEALVTIISNALTK